MKHAAALAVLLLVTAGFAQPPDKSNPDRINRLREDWLLLEGQPDVGKRLLASGEESLEVLIDLLCEPDANCLPKRNSRRK